LPHPHELFGGEGALAVGVELFLPLLVLAAFRWLVAVVLQLLEGDVLRVLIPPPLTRHAGVSGVVDEVDEEDLEGRLVLLVVGVRYLAFDIAVV
jgi:hypothetical protein